MLVGIISDTHDNLPMVDKVIKRLNSENVDLVLHAGDYVSPFVIPKFRALHARLIGVLGNNDGDREMLERQFKASGNCELHGRFALVEAEGFKIALLHGSDTELLNALISNGGFDAVVHGHTHALTVNQGKTLILNPGEACGYLTGKTTIALLDTQKRVAEILQI